MTARLMRLCDICGGYDDYPRHVLALLTPSPAAVPSQEFLAQVQQDHGNVSPLAVAELMDDTTFVRHVNCCANAGCEECAATLDRHDGAEGDALTQAITGNPA